MSITYHWKLCYFINSILVFFKWLYRHRIWLKIDMMNLPAISSGACILVKLYEKKFCFLLFFFSGRASELLRHDGAGGSLGVRPSRRAVKLDYMECDRNCCCRCCCRCCCCCRCRPVCCRSCSCWPRIGDKLHGKRESRYHLHGNGPHNCRWRSVFLEIVSVFFCPVVEFFFIGSGWILLNWLGWTRFDVSYQLGPNIKNKTKYIYNKHYIVIFRNDGSHRVNGANLDLGQQLFNAKSAEHFHSLLWTKSSFRLELRRAWIYSEIWTLNKIPFKRINE